MFNVQEVVQTFKNLSRIAAVQKQQLPIVRLPVGFSSSGNLDGARAIFKSGQFCRSLDNPPPRAIPTSDEPKYRVKGRNDAR